MSTIRGFPSVTLVLFAVATLPLFGGKVAAASRQPTYISVDCASPGSSAASSSTANFTTIREAQVYVAALPRPLPAPIVVDVVSDCTVLEPFQLHGPNDSGSGPDTTVTWTSSTGSTLAGGVAVPGGLWTPVPSPPSVGVPPLPVGHTLLVLNYSKLASPITVGAYKSAGLGSCRQTRAELFIGGRPMTVARFPNAPVEPGEPWLDWLFVTRVGSDSREEQGPRDRTSANVLKEHRAARSQAELGGGMDRYARDAPRTFQTSVDAPRAQRWANMSAAGRAAMWAHGYWKFDWADNYIQIDQVTVLPQSSTDDESLSNSVQLQWSNTTQPVYSMEKSGRFYVLNIKSELDQAGEYFFDEEEQLLYVVTNASIDPRQSDAYISVNPGPLLSAIDVSYVTISELAIMYSRGTGITVANGDHVTVAGVTSSNHGRDALGVHGTNLRVEGLVSQYAGCGAASIGGGDEFTLVSANNVIKSGTVERYSRFTRTYNPGVGFSDVGHTISNMVIRHGPHNAILGSGNNMIFDSNHISHVCYGTNDAGAWYSGRSWVHRGTVLVRNVFENITNLEPSKIDTLGVHAVYLDDELSGISVLDTTCVNVDTCMLLGGGRDNVVANMMCHNVGAGCATFDNRGMGWQRAMCSNGTAGPGVLVQGLEKYHYQQPPYSTAYAGLPTTMQDRPCVPVGNAFVNTICTNCVMSGHGPRLIDRSAQTIESWNSTIVGSCSGSACSGG